MQRSAGAALVALVLLALLVAAPLPVQAGPLVVYCTHDPDACELAAQAIPRAFRSTIPAWTNSS